MVMSDNTKTLILIGSGIFMIVVGFLLGWNIKPTKVCPTIIDSVYVIGDTVFIPYPVEVIKWKERETAVIYDSTEQEYEGYFDSLFVSHRDTIGIDLAVVFAEKTKEFEIDMNIQHKDVEIFRTDTIKVNYTEIKEIEVDNPLYIWTTVIGGLLLLLSIIFGG